MNQWSQWVSMGGYASYVWSAYGLVVFVLLFQFLNMKRRQKRTRQLLRAWFKSAS